MKLPKLTERPEPLSIVILLAYWFLMFLMAPVVMGVFQFGSFDDPNALAGRQMIFHLLTCIVLALLFRERLVDSWLEIQINGKKVIAIALVGAGVAYGVTDLLMALTPLLWPDFPYAYVALPVTEYDLSVYAATLLKYHPIPGFFCVTLLTPVSIVCLLYGPGFGVAACKKTWLGYVVMILVLVIHRTMFAYLVASWEIGLGMFLMQLPIFMLGCLVYQLSDTVWAPIFYHAALNLIAYLFT